MYDEVEGIFESIIDAQGKFRSLYDRPSDIIENSQAMGEAKSKRGQVRWREEPST